MNNLLRLGKQIQNFPAQNNLNITPDIRKAILNQQRETKMSSKELEDNAIRLEQEIRNKSIYANQKNEPYKTILPRNMIKPHYNTADELVVYKTTQADKDIKKLESDFNAVKTFISNHNTELKDKYSSSHEEEFKKQFEYNQTSKYSVKYDPNGHEDMKDTVINYYKQEQLKMEKDKQCVDDIVENVMGNLKQQEVAPKDDIRDKYRSRQKNTLA